MPSIVDIAVQNDGFSTLVAAVQAAGLVEVLATGGPFTVFAPHDDAFAKLPPGTVQTLVDNPPQLARILKFHVVSGIWHKDDIAQQAALISLEGSPIPVRTEPIFEVKNSTVLAADITASNGVIHVIDTVILMG